VQVHYGDGRVVKDESIHSPDFSIDGGDEVEFAIVKSGRTAQRFDCDSAPITVCSGASTTTATG
jgi:hypothetical protein